MPTGMAHQILRSERNACHEGGPDNQPCIHSPEIQSVSSGGCRETPLLQGSLNPRLGYVSDTGLLFSGAAFYPKNPFQTHEKSPSPDGERAFSMSSNR